MGDKSAIQWTDATWNPVVGCSITSPGCRLCYAMSEAARQVRCAAGLKRDTHYAGTVETVKGRPVWTGKIASAPDHIWEAPLRWRRPRRIFVNSMGDLFHEDVPDEWIDRAFAIMALAPQHTFQVLTKRSARMREYFSAKPDAERIELAMDALPMTDDMASSVVKVLDAWPLPNVWLGVSTERQQEADERIPDLLQTPAAVRFISAEPLLGPLDLMGLIQRPGCETITDALQGCVGYNAGPDEDGRVMWEGAQRCSKLDWVIVGGESSRLKLERPTPMHPDCVRSLRDQCAAAGVPFFFKQWGDWLPKSPTDGWRLGREHAVPDGECLKFFKGWPPSGTTKAPSFFFERVGTAEAGRLLDGREHNDLPNVGATHG